uniref:NADH-ubiquinone oxidoreductase chain 5 n=1 Tax=Clambus sp. CLA01 TaxID=1205546 RepID=A0A0S2MMY2_9COLE|nr:NADH deshydrogenase subunit 5 [Clambus sp. CLA01]
MIISICYISFIMLLILSMNSFFFSLLFMMNDFVMILDYQLVSVNSSIISMALLFDWMSLMFMSFVFFISSMVILYSEEYMLGDINLNRFIILVLLFVLSMMFLIISPNLISILLGWDGLGLVSYCLVIYYQNVKSYNAGMLTVLTNRIGDVALLLAIAWMLNYGSWNFIYYLEFMKNDYQMMFISWMVILAALTKSAQIPFSSWLPAAMAAPTPVSSLVHSSTLVTAGVYLLIRFNFSLTMEMKMFLLFISTFTMFMAGLGANFEYDLKKIVALSTLSQLGLMISILAMGFYNLAFFHLLSHALFKALLFMCSGAIIHNMKNCQDIRFMGGLVHFMPFTVTCFNVCNLSLCGFPFLAGFYSKDMILEISSMSGFNNYIYIFYYFSIGLTVSYTFRLYFYSIINNFNFLVSYSFNEEEWKMLKSMLGLVFVVIFGGSMLSWLIFPTPNLICLPFYMKYMVFLLILMGTWVGGLISYFWFSWDSYLQMNYKKTLFVSLMWFLPLISTMFLNKHVLKIGSVSNKYLDYGWLEYYGGQGLFQFMVKSSMLKELYYNNNLKIYFMMFIGFMLGLMYIY